MSLLGLFAISLLTTALGAKSSSQATLMHNWQSFMELSQESSSGNLYEV